MNKLLLTTLLVASSAASAAQDVAKVVSSIPVTQQVGVAREACATSATPGVAPKCSTQTIYETRTVAYNVIYEYKGKRFSVQLPQDPGPSLRLQIGAVEAMAQPAPALASAPVASAGRVVSVVPADPAYPQGDVVEDPAMATQTVVVGQPYPPPVLVTYANPGYVSYYGSPYYGYGGPVVSLGFVGGFYGGGYHRYGGFGHGHRH